MWGNFYICSQNKLAMISEQEFLNVANELKCEVAVLKTVYKVEANGSGFLDDGLIKGEHDSEDRVKILFEGHRFWKALSKIKGIDIEGFLAKEENREYKNVLYKFWDKKQYKGGEAEWKRMSKAIEVCNKLNVSTDLALDSASYGSFQIMGENHDLCGYASSHEMLADYNKRGEIAQLESFVKFVKSKNLVRYLISKNFPKFAEGYNGSAYRENQYDVKLLTTYKKLAA